MTVFVDDMKASFGRMVMAHLIGDDEVELHALAGRIGVARKWFQGDHYDIAVSKKRLAIREGAVPVTWRQAGCMMALQRRGLPMPKPEDAEAAWQAYRRRPIRIVGSG